MNLPNKLTILRTILIPFFLIFIYTDFWENGQEVVIDIRIIRQSDTK